MVHTFKIPERKYFPGYQRLPDLQEALFECDSEEGELSKPTPTRTSKTAQVKSLIMKFNSIYNGKIFESRIFSLNQSCIIRFVTLDVRKMSSPKMDR